MSEAERLKEECRGARGARWLEEAKGDLHFAVRTLRRTPVFAGTVIAALAFCIGGNIAIFSVVDTVLFSPLTVPQSGSFGLGDRRSSEPGISRHSVSCPDYLFVAANNRSFEATGGYRTQSYEISGVGRSRRAIGARLTPSIFQVLRVSPAVAERLRRKRTNTPSGHRLKLRLRAKRVWKAGASARSDDFS
jgi:hypothetical protein